MSDEKSGVFAHLLHIHRRIYGVKCQDVVTVWPLEPVHDSTKMKMITITAVAFNSGLTRDSITHAVTDK